VKAGGSGKENDMKNYTVYNGSTGAVMSSEWEILEQWGGKFTPEEILEWAHASALRANAAYDRTVKNLSLALAFAKETLGEKAEVSRFYSWDGVRVDTVDACAGIEHAFTTFDISGVKNPKYGQLNTYSVAVNGFGECQLVSWLA